MAPNGNGKSTIVEALYYCLFGKPYRDINLSQLINGINKKELEVNAWFHDNTTSYRVERGMKPNYFRIYVKTADMDDFEIVPQSSTTRSYQQIFEEDILKMTPKIFDQTVMKSLTKNISFLTLTKGEKREIVENFLDIKVFTEMNKLCKTKVDELDKDLIEVKKNREHVQILFTQEESNLQRLQRIQQQQRDEAAASATRIEAEVRSLNKEITEFQSNIAILNEKIVARLADNEKKKADIEKVQKYKTKKVEFQDAIKVHQAAIKTVQEKIGEHKTTIAGHKTIISGKEEVIRDWKNLISITENKVKYLTGTCGNCENINKISKADNLDKLKEDVALELALIEGRRTSIKEVEELIVGCNEEITTITADINKCNNNIGKCDEYIGYERTFNNDIANNNKFIESERNSIVSDERRITLWQQKIKEKQTLVVEESKQEIEIDFSKLEELKITRADLAADFDKKTILKKHYVYARKLLADDAIKAFVVKKYLPSINAILNSYLQRFSSEIILHLDAEFNEVVTSRFKENYSYFSFSEGQKRRIDLAILFTWIHFCKTKFKQAETNLLILDEVGVGIDAESQDKLYRILRELASKENKSIITISHDSTIDVGKINHLYEITIESGFSKITKKNI